MAYTPSGNDRYSLRIIDDGELQSIEDNEIPAWSLEELLSFLPRCITSDGKKYRLVIYRTRGNNFWSIKYTNGRSLIEYQNFVYLINAAFTMVRYFLTDGKKYLE